MTGTKRPRVLWVLATVLLAGCAQLLDLEWEPAEGQASTSTDGGGAGGGRVLRGIGDLVPGGGAAGGADSGDCDDGIVSGSETDTDCGGPDCDPCDEWQQCLVDDDCKKHVCWYGICDKHGHDHDDDDFRVTAEGRP